MLLYLTFKKISENSENLNSLARWGHGLAHSRDGPAASSSIGFVRPWFGLLYKSDHGVDFAGKLKVIADRLSQSVDPAQSNHV